MNNNMRTKIINDYNIRRNYATAAVYVYIVAVSYNIIYYATSVFVQLIIIY